ncbi:VWA containing CoxE family protein (plasmid) [Anabaenopsis circularis NIES-21]|uniref:VWA containing CoxE family protein n=1 Tax=Anabaenopsis circularis NIES-21 TaxID=1085406 RepID=A0A1Z4GR85_9CYAN|nr:VWA containing CoxE family protein [Anabaenopsis circularis NIES-21]
MDDLPLLELFTRLRQAGLPLGVDDYQSMLQAVQAGYGLPDRDALARLCRLLWVKSVEEKHIFDYHFEQLIGSETVPQTQASDVNQSQTTQRIIFATLMGVLVLGAGLALWVTRPKHQVSTVSLPTSVPIPTQSPSPVQQAIVPTPTVQITQNETQRNWQVWLILLLVLAAVSSGCWWLLRFLVKRRAQNHQLQTEQSKPIPTTTLASESFRNIEDEVQVAQAIRQVASDNAEVLGNSFLFSMDYLPVTQRQMKQMWRHLRRLTKEGIATELDVEATVNQIGRYGMMLEPVLSPVRVNRTELLLLIDQDGSMVPFHSLSVRLGQTASRGGQLGAAGIYYFHNCPVGYLYHDPLHQQAESIENVFAHLRQDRVVALIFSDAGAARGGLNSERIKLTETFLKQLKQHVRYVAWLNPIPKKRWLGTTAGEIAELVPMFEATRGGLDSAINALRGRHQQFTEPLEGVK